VRLPRVRHGHAFKERLILWLVGAINRARVPDVIRTLLYRPAFFGGRMSPFIQQVMRGPSEWSPGERELFAAFVSRLNQCPF
jgi:hypothetical protein